MPRQKDSAPNDYNEVSASLGQISSDENVYHPAVGGCRREDGVTAMTVDDKPPQTGLTVALVTPWERKGGIASYSARFAEALRDRGVTVEPVPVPETQPANPFAFGVLVDAIPAHADVVHVQFEAGLFGRLGLTGVGAPWLFHRLANNPRPVITTLHEVHATHDHRGPVGDRLLRVRDWVIERAAIRASNQILVHTRESAKILRRRHPGVSVERMLHPVDEDTKRIPIDRAKTRLGLNDEVITTFGWVERKKRYRDVIETLPALPSTTYLIAGEPRPNEGEAVLTRALELARNRGVRDRVRHLGYVEDDDVPAVFCATDVVVLPYERVSQSGVLNDSLAYRRPTVTTSLPVFEEVADRYGCVLTYDRSIGPENSLRKALYDDAVRAALTEAAGRYVDRENWGQFADRTLEMYRSIGS